MKKFFRKNFLPSLLSVCVIFSGVFCTSGAYAYDGSLKNYIIITDVPALLSPDVPAFFSEGDAFKQEYREELLSYQNGIIDEIISGRLDLMGMGEEEKRPFSYHFTDVLSGFTLEMTEDEAKKAEAIEGVRLVAQDITIAVLDDTIVSQSTSDASSDASSDELSAAIAYSKLNAGNLIGVPKARELGYNGEGRVVAVIDSSIQPLHPYLKLSGTTVPRHTEETINSIINTGILNVKSSSGVYRTSKVPFAYDYCYNKAEISSASDHGLHVSGIIAGNSLNFASAEDTGLIDGVAPEAQIVFMGIFNTSGSASLSTFMAALDDASKLGADAVNMSIGIPGASENYSEGANGILKEMAKNINSGGISLIYSAGNDGHEAALSTSVSDYSIADNSLFPSVMRIGSVQSEFAYLYCLTDDKGNEYPCEQIGKSRELSLTDIVILSDASAESLLLAQGKTAVITLPDKALGTLSLGTVAKNASAAGVKAVAFINNINQIQSGTVSNEIPLFYIPQSAGEKLKQTAEKLSFTPQRKVQRIHSAPVASGFSSFGVSDNLDITIDFSAPGGHILSSRGLSASNMGYGNMSGTSMATPFLTGAISLLYERIEKDFPAYEKGEKTLLARQLLSSTADNVYEENGALSSVRQVGSGLVQFDKALITNAVLTSADSSEYPSVSLGDNLGKSFDVSFKVKNLSSEALSFPSLTVELASEGYKYYEQRKDYAYSGMQKLECEVSPNGAISIEGNEEKIITLTITPDADTLSELDTVMRNGYFIDGKITLSGSEENCDLTIPFTGFRKSWLSQRIIPTSALLKSTYLLSIASDGRYSYCFPEEKDGKLVLYMSDTPDPAFLSGTAYIVTKPQRNAYASLKSALGALSADVFFPKGYELVLPLSSFEDVSKSSDGLKLQMRLPYRDLQSYTQTSQFNFEKDNEAPTFSLEYSSGTVKVTASDNQKVTTVSAIGKDLLGKTKTVAKELDASWGTAELDISSLSDVDFYVSDNAFNTTHLACGLYFENENDALWLKNINKTSCEGNVFIASYEKIHGKKVLKKIEKLQEKILLEPFAVKEIDKGSFENENCTVFFWDVENGFVPLAKFQ